MITDTQFRLKHRWESAKTWKDVAGHEAGLWPFGAQVNVQSMLMEIQRLREYIKSLHEMDRVCLDTKGKLKKIYLIKDDDNESRTEQAAD